MSPDLPLRRVQQGLWYGLTLLCILVLPLWTHALPLFVFLLLEHRRGAYWDLRAFLQKSKLMLLAVSPGCALLISSQLLDGDGGSTLGSLATGALWEATIRTSLAMGCLLLLQVLIPAPVWFDLLQPLPPILFTLGLFTWNWIKRCKDLVMGFEQGRQLRFRSGRLAWRREVWTGMLARISIEAWSGARTADYGRRSRRLPLPLPRGTQRHFQKALDRSFFGLSGPFVIPLVYGFLL